MTSIEKLATLSVELINELESIIIGEYSDEEIKEFLEKNKEYINTIFNMWSRMEEVPQDIFLYMLELGLNINQIFSGVDGENKNCNFAVHCAEFRQFETLNLMLENGLILPTEETLNSENNIIDTLISGHSHGDIDYNVFDFIEIKLKGHPLIICEGTVEMIRDLYMKNFGSYYEYYHVIMVKFLCSVIIQQIKREIK